MSGPRPGLGVPAEEWETDVLVIGGGLAGLVAAGVAGTAGVRVTVLAKGFAGADGVSPFAGGVALCLFPEDDLDAFLDEHEWACEGLLHREAVARVAAISGRLWEWLAAHGVPVEREPAGTLRRRWLRVGGRSRVPRLALESVSFMRHLRRCALGAGARIFDHSVVTELLTGKDGGVAGAVGFRYQEGRLFRIRARAVVLAAGGCAWRGAHMGVHSAMGEGYGLAVRAGAELASMEYCTSYIATCSLFDSHGQDVLAALGGRFRNRLGENILERYGEPDPAPPQRLSLAMITEWLEGRGPIVFDLRAIPAERRRQWERDFPLVARALARTGVDVFARPVPWIPGFTGSIAGSGGVRTLDLAGRTTVPGLFVAGDTACRTPVVGAGSGLTYLNLSWALASGCWAGAAAAELAREGLPAPTEPAVEAEAWNRALAPLGREGGTRAVDVLRRLQRLVVDPERNFFRTAAGLESSLRDLERLWDDVRRLAAADWHDLVRCHEVEHATLTALAMFSSALVRQETRGWHRRLDFPRRDDHRWRRWTVARLEPCGERPEFRVHTIALEDPAAFDARLPAAEVGALP
ncbi:MAG TPA: FAD-binding protein [Thermaerobacter sp.]